MAAAQYMAVGGGVLIGPAFYAPGQDFESDLPPARSWKPLNAEAKARCAERDTVKAVAYAEQAPFDVPVPEAVTIPGDWQDLRPEQVVNLARRMGAARTCNFTRAVVHIERELAARAAQRQGDG